MLGRSAAVLLGVVLLLSTRAMALNTYHVGNSLTWDTRPTWLDDWNPSHTAGWHIRSNQGLAYMWSNPSETTVEPTSFGTYGEALPNYAWDAVIMQPFTGSTLGDEVAAYLDLLDLTQTNPANNGTTFYIHAPWPNADAMGSWLTPYTVDDATPSMRTRGFYEAMLSAVRTQTSADVFIVPTGEVIVELNQRILDGQVPGHTSIADFYRDNVHMDTALGRYVAAATLYATLYGVHPDGLQIVKDGAIPSPFTQPSSAWYTAVNDTIWDVVSSYQYSGITLTGDLNGDGFVGQDDLNIILSHWGQSVAPGDPLQGDPSADGMVGQDDLNEVLTGWGGGAPPAAQLAVVPEPSVLALLLPWLMVRLGKRRWATSG